MKNAFRLQRLLELREKQVEECKAKLQTAARLLTAAEDVFNSVRAAGEELGLNWHDNSGAGMSAWQAVDFQIAMFANLEELRAAAKETERLRHELTERRGELEAARTKASILEKARERAMRRAAAGELRREQAQLDEHSMLMEARP